MDNIIKFPSKTVRDKALIEKTIKELLGQIPTDQEAKNEMTERLLAIWEMYQHNFSLPLPIPFPGSLSDQEKNEILGSIEQLFEMLAKSFHDYTNVILLEHFKSDINLYLSERRT